MLTVVLEATEGDPQVKVPVPVFSTGSHPKERRHHGQPAPILATRPPQRSQTPAAARQQPQPAPRPHPPGIFTRSGHPTGVKCLFTRTGE